MRTDSGATAKRLVLQPVGGTAHALRRGRALPGPPAGRPPGRPRRPRARRPLRPPPTRFPGAGGKPDGPVLVSAQTSIRIAGNRAADGRAAITYEDIGGLAQEMRRIREMIELPLRYPVLFERLGIDPPKGVLLHGPPGTGKTLIARGRRPRDRRPLLHINGPEIIHKFYGESEANLRRSSRRRAAPRRASSSSTKSTPSPRSASEWWAMSRSASSRNSWRCMDGLNRRAAT